MNNDLIKKVSEIYKNLDLSLESFVVIGSKNITISKMGGYDIIVNCSESSRAYNDDIYITLSGAFPLNYDPDYDEWYFGISNGFNDEPLYYLSTKLEEYNFLSPIITITKGDETIEFSPFEIMEYPESYSNEINHFFVFILHLIYQFIYPISLYYNY